MSTEVLRGLPYLAALTLAATFAVAALAKWRDPAATARGFAALGVPRPWPAARTVPAVEAALALGLVVAPAGMAVLASMLLAGFTVFLVTRLRQGVTAPCHCFGGRGGGPGDPLSRADVVRNLWLLAAGLVAATGSWPEAPSAAAVLVFALVTAVAVATVRLLRRPGSLPS